jgi:hypothetical protein
MSDHGLDPNEEREKFAAYMAAFDIPPEAPAAPHDAGNRAANLRPAARVHLGASPAPQ